MRSDLEYYTSFVPLGRVPTQLVSGGHRGTDGNTLETPRIPCKFLTNDFPRLCHHSLPQFLRDTPVSISGVLVGEAGDMIP